MIGRMNGRFIFMMMFQLLNAAPRKQDNSSEAFENNLFRANLRIKD